MKFFLSEHAPIAPFRRVAPGGGGRHRILSPSQSSRYQVSVDPSGIRPCDGNSKSVQLCDKLRQHLESANTISFELTTSTNVRSGSETIGLRVLKGPVTNAVVALCGRETKLQLTFTDLRSDSDSLVELKSSEMKLDEYGGCEDAKLCTEHEDAWDCLSGSNLRGDVTITVICDGVAVSGPVVTDKMQVYRKMLLEEIRSDVVIIPGNGKEVKAHTNVLAAQSDVFSAMFQSDMQEAKTHTAEMADMSEEGVRGLLAYLYCWEEEEPNAKPLVAFEMLHAGHKYNIPVLETAMKKLLLAKPDKWYDVEVAMKLFLLAKNLPEDGHALKMKAIQVMKINFGNFKKSPTYVALFKENPEAAMELCEYAFA